jgi:thioredoxin reductase
MNQNVLIIGAGPVGLTLAIELARFGVPVRIIEQAALLTYRPTFNRVALRRAPGPVISRGNKQPALRLSVKSTAMDPALFF